MTTWIDRLMHLGLVVFVTALAAAVTTWSRHPPGGHRTAPLPGL